jgi:hypothetical protein
MRTTTKSNTSVLTLPALLRGLLPAMGLVLLVAQPALAQLDPLPFIKIESSCFYVQGTMHLAATNFPDIHNVLPPGAAWSTPFQIGEQAYGSFILRGTNQHIVQCDLLDSPKGEFFPYSASLSVGFGEGIVDTRFGGAVAHTPHQDDYVVAFAAFSIVREWLGGTFWNETRGHVHGSLGIHRPFPKKGGGGGGANIQGLSAILSGQSATPTNDSVGVGALAVIADLASNTLSLSLTVQNITPEQILGASVQLGPQGPPLLHLGSWEAYGTNGSHCLIEDAPLQIPYMQMLLAGQCYLNLQTTNYPQGEIAGQITAIPAAVRLAPPVLSAGQARIDLYVENGFPQSLQLQVASAAEGPWLDSGVIPQLVDSNHYQATVPASDPVQFFRVQAR